MSPRPRRWFNNAAPGLIAVAILLASWGLFISCERSRNAECIDTGGKVIHIVNAFDACYHPDGRNP